MHPGERVTLAERLFRLRKNAGLTGDQLAAQLGWGAARTKVSKIENGHQVPTSEEIQAWALAAGQPEVTDELLDLQADTKVMHTRWRARLKHGSQAAIQQDFDARTRAATRVRWAELALIPGLLQTSAYARSVIVQGAALYPVGDISLTAVDNTEATSPEDPDIAAAVQARMQRQDVLYDQSKTFEFIIAEAALRLLPCPPQVMLGQLDRLLSLGMDNVTLGIIPFGQAQLIPLNGFYLLDDDLTVEHWGGKIQDSAGEQAALYHRIFDALMAEAVTGEDARGLLAATANALRV